jgi:hypothetical protein
VVIGRQRTRCEEDDWPFLSNFDADVAELEPGEYYPKTM